MSPVVTGFSWRVHCPVCNSERLENNLNFDGLRTAVCLSCGFHFTQNFRSKEDALGRYVDRYWGDRQKCGQMINADVNCRVVAEFVPNLRGKNVLDVGSGYGYFAKRLSELYSARVSGVELSAAERNYAIQENGVETYNHISDLPPSRFDIITLFEVIEHIPRPLEFVASVCELLRSGGALIIGTDNFESDIVRALGKSFPKWIPHEHVSLFTNQSLPNLLERTGCLDIAKKKSFTSWELRLRQVIFIMTAGRYGGKTFNLAYEEATENSRPFRYFKLRRAINGLWYILSRRNDLYGEMMFVCAFKK